MKKLIQTSFVYTFQTLWDGSPGRVEKASGSYLGRKPASVKTIYGFLRANARAACVPQRILSVVSTGSLVSQWISK
jgi:hypothetical protein